MSVINIDKALLEQRFSKAVKTYNNHATVQKKMAQRLIDYVKIYKSNYKNILEIGSGAGLLTKLIDKNLSFDKLYANDIIKASKNFVQLINNDIEFIYGDIEKIAIPFELDLVISNATFQWVSNLVALLLKLNEHVTSNSLIAFTTFGNKNYKEFDQLGYLQLKYYNSNDILRLIRPYFKILLVEEEEEVLYFDTPIEILKHIQRTGVNSIGQFTWTKKKIINFLKNYENQFTFDNKVRLTYNPIYILAEAF